MCGFAGIINVKNGIQAADTQILKRMNEAQAHRGPDGEGYYHGVEAALAHKRLAVIDLAGSAQPALLGAKVMVYNGEIYNFREVRQKLSELGHVFSQNGDTEVLLHAFEQWGAGCLEHLNGDFSFAVWDDERKALFLARDRLGVKPLYYTFLNDTLIFSSEIKGVLAHPGVRRTLDIQGLIEGLTYSQPIPPKTLIKDLCALEPGHYLRFSKHGLEKVKYWDLEYRQRDDGFDVASKKIADLITDAVRIRMVGDVPLCGLLSGGLDSSILCTLMAEHGAALNAFSVDFKGNQHAQAAGGTHVHDSDIAHAAAVSSHIGAKHIYEEIDPDRFESLMADACRARDMPVVLGSEAGMAKLFEMVRDQATVALSGDGADEIFLGYYMVVNEAAMDDGISPFFVAPTDKFFHILQPWIITQYKPKKYITNRFNQFVDAAPSMGDPETRNLNLIHYLQIKFILPYLLDRADRISMANSVEVRVPYCDHRIAEYMFSLSSDLKFRSGEEKHLLRNAFKGRVLDSALKRKKSVFPYPFEKQVLEALFEKTAKVLQDPTASSSITQIFDPKNTLSVLELARQGFVDAFVAHSLCAQILSLDSLLREQGWDIEASAKSNAQSELAVAG